MPERIPDTKKAKKEYWTEGWEASGMRYNMLAKALDIAPIFKRLEEEGKIGSVVVDIGSGVMPVSVFIPNREQKKIITVDFAGESTSITDESHIRFDLSNLETAGGYATAMARIKAANILELEGDIREAAPEQVDTMIFSEVLNYVDYKSTLREMTKFIKPGGRIFILNQAKRGDAAQFESETGPKGAQDVSDYVRELGFETEFEHKIDNQSPEIRGDDRMLVLLARKKEEIQR